MMYTFTDVVFPEDVTVPLTYSFFLSLSRLRLCSLAVVVWGEWLPPTGRPLFAQGIARVGSFAGGASAGLLACPPLPLPLIRWG